MHVTITTDGGFTGRGIGSRSADVDEGMLGELRPESWRAEYRASGGADLIRFTLTLDERSVSWDEGAEIPEDLRRLFERVWQ
jgi:hypothetical protein